MTKSLLILATGIIVFGVGLQQLFHLRSEAQAPPTRGPSAGVPSPSSRTGGRTRPAPQTRTVQIVVDGLNFAFSPASITVPRGSRVVWVSRTASPHTITSVTPHLFDASIRGRGRVALRFLRPGTYQYYCALHPYMLGVIHVRS
jgi:plastocyanin